MFHTFRHLAAVQRRDGGKAQVPNYDRGHRKKLARICTQRWKRTKASWYSKLAQQH